MEIMTTKEVAALLKMSKSQVYELVKTKTRAGEVRDLPLPVLKINCSIRFLRSDIEAWIEKLRINGR